MRIVQMAKRLKELHVPAADDFLVYHLVTYGA